MKRGMGVFALFAVLLAGARFAAAPSPAKTGSAGSLLQHVSDSLDVASTNCSESADASQGKITTLVDQYLHGVLGQAMPDSGSGRLPADIRFMVATVPDPLHTHLNLLFDRTIEATQQAAQDERYTYDSSWLPWKQRAAEYSGRDDESKEEKETIQRENCPGLILFRKSIQQPDRQLYDATYTQGLFLFLVAEKPTTGIDRTQWNNALSWIDRHISLTSTEKGLRVLGPTFSGSVPSMVRAVIDVGKQSPKNSFKSVLLYTGTMRGCSAYAWMNLELIKSSPLPVRTADFEENDAIHIDRYFQYLTKRGHHLSEVAILSEDETAYGGLPDNHPASDDRAQLSDPSRPTCEPIYGPRNRPLHLYYPRDISALRSAYEEQSIFAATDSSSASHVVLQPQASRSTHQDTDTVATFSGANSALAQEAQMYGIVDSLRTHGIRFVILRSTSSLDHLFLTRFLHRAYPDAVIVTMGSDMLFGREIDSTEFRGVVALTAFPLLPRGQDWTAVTENSRRHAHRVFGSNSMEGSYLATRFLIGDPDITHNESPPYLHPYPYDRSNNPSAAGVTDYAPPVWVDPHPAGVITPSTWLSVVGRDGYWPLAVLKEPYNPYPDSPAPILKSNLALVQVPSDATAHPVRLRGLLSLSASWKLCCELAVLAILLHSFACRRGWRYQNLSMLIQFTPSPGIRQITLIALGWGVIVTALVLMFLCSFLINPYLHAKDSWWIWGLAFVALFGSMGTVVDIHWRFSGKPCAILRRTRPHIAWIAFPVLLFAVALWTGWSTFNGSDPDAVPTAYRAVHLTSGVSPMVSLLIMLAGFYWSFWFTLSGLALLGQGRPLLLRRKKLPLALSRISDEMADNIEGFAMPLPSPSKQKVIFYVFPAVLLLLQYWVLHRSSADGLDLMLHSLENISFDRTLQVSCAIALYLVVMESGQLLSTWLALKRLLLALNRTPLRRTFFALRGLSMSSLWSMSGTSSRSRYTIFSHQLEALHHLRNVLQSLPLKARGPGHDWISKELDRALNKGKEFIEVLSGKENEESDENLARGPDHKTLKKKASKKKRKESEGNPAQGADLAMINDEHARHMRKEFRLCVEHIFQELILPRWLEEKKSLDLAENGEKPGCDEVLRPSDDEVTQRAEEFVCLSYVSYLVNILGRMRTMVLSILGLFAAIAFSLAFYPYTPRPAIVLSLLFLLLVVGSIVAVVYAGLSRDATVSHITNTEPGALGPEFWVKLATSIGVPFIGLLAAQFPGITDFLVSWLEPCLNSVK